MSNSEHEPTNRPAAGAVFEPLDHLLTLQFQMPLKFVRQKGLEFAARLSTFLDPRQMELQESQWMFTQQAGDNSSGFFRLIIGETQLSIESVLGGNRLQWFEDRCGLILDEFHRSFTPVLVLVPTIRITGTLQIDGDARVFLSRHVTNFDVQRLQALKRPVQLFGIRFSMPPYQHPLPPKGRQKKGAAPKVEVVDWLIEAKAESLLADPTKLFLETLFVWQKPVEWDTKTTKTLVGRLKEVEEFLKQRLIPCLVDDPMGGK
jgi:hypothetical protein